MSKLEFGCGEVGGEGKGGSFFESGEIEHEVCHDALHDGAEATCTEMVFDGAVDDEVEGLGGELEGNVVHAKELLILLDEGVLGLGEDTAQGLAIEGLEGGEDRESAHEFGDVKSVNILKKN